MEVFCRYIVAVWLILNISFTAKAAQFPCGYQYFPDADAWFKLHKQEAFWSEASDACILEGSELAAPTSDAIKDAMLSLMYSDENDNSNIFNIYIVHTALRPTGAMKNDVKFQDFEGFAIGLTDVGQLQRVNLYLALPFICYKKVSPALQLNECDPGYTLDNRTNKCYKFHHSRDTWWGATVSCITEKGDLAVINSDKEAEVIRDIFARNPAEDILGWGWKDSAFLGYFADGKRNWKTLQGQSLSEAGYDGWSPGEPNNARGDEYCVSVGRNGMLFDDPCTRALPYICEKERIGCEIAPLAYNTQPKVTYQPDVTTVRSLVTTRASQNEKKP